MLKKLRHLNSFFPGELFVLLQFVALASAARLALKVLRFSRVMELVARGASNSCLKRLPFFQHRYELVRLTRLADIAARNTRAGGPCLIRSLLLFWLLKARGEPVELLIGVSKETSILRSHAWIETHQRAVIGDNPEITGAFATFLRF